MERARASFKYLWRELTWEYRRIVPAFELSAIKAAFKDPGGDASQVEHMWLTDIEFDGEVIRATLMNAPHELTSVAAGDSITLSLADVEDWMYVREGRLYGGFTIQVLRGQMSEAARHEHDEAWGFTFADPGEVDLVADGNPDAEHRMSENMAVGLPETIAEDPERFFAVGPAGLSTLHSMALGGSAACVSALLQAGADPLQKTTSGRTARELAASMGWPRVVELLREVEARAGQ